ncbi:MAG: LysM domain-containing protein [Methylicorpusculum sp.]|uniref:LysM peptidoglycan-binding domain-containing protein n=1 Tax=Methylicorpusculum sp. TaxID=2713644 RepID=UPI002721D8A1|nr:LysM domain-containing protein [Methylicorpusculum sp.]MDO8939095.1 LysM domain-containing protein [Methylicorpusculum sp.]MDO9240763.1 LysM domain-containing protein [Methylicorpusculum sp.]MDP2200914.1 LysM domain-containing protein [Methylicorpusculum sp.]
MALRNLLGLLALLISNLAISEELIAINPNHPDRYTVVEGDTLWHIAGRFLQRPEQWPYLWQTNQQIENPHLIYPGDTIVFSLVNGQPQLSLANTNVSSYETSENADYVKLTPRIRETDLRQAIKLIPSETIAKYLVSPRIVGPDELNKAPYIIDFAGDRLLAGAGDRIYVRAIEQPETLSYTIYRQGDTLKSPNSAEILGYEAKYIAEATLNEKGDPATLTITKSTSEIRTGDRLMTREEGDFTLNYFPHAPEETIEGNIINVLDGVTQIGRYNVVSIDKGQVDNISVGHVFDIYRSGKTVRDTFSIQRNDEIQMPDEIAGKLMVFRVFERVSYALVMEATQAIHVLDRVRTP